MLSDSENEDLTLTINEHYAKAYAHRKEREELQKLKDKYGSDAEFEDEEEEDSEDLESEDEDGEELTPAVDVAILRTLARIKGRDPAIYDAEAAVFQEEREKLGSAQPTARKVKDKSVPMTLRQQALDAVLNPHGSRSPSPAPLTHVEEQRALRSETISAFHRAAAGDEEDEQDEDDLLVPREKTKDEIEREEEEYREFLEREVGEDLRTLVTVEGTQVREEAGDDEKKAKKKGKKERKKKREKEEVQGKTKEEEDQDFLMNYILNRGWIDRSSRRVPTYGEVTNEPKRKGKGKAKSEDAANSEQDESDGERAIQDAPDHVHVEEPEGDDFEDVVDTFESSYNFRFEEPDAAEIKRYPRTLQSTVRREDTSRKEAREKRRARKDEELARKREEIARLKALKMRELRTKLERIGREGGKALDEDAALQALDLDADWDPDAHDRQMLDIYGGPMDEHDQDMEGDGGGDLEKPMWDDDIDIEDLASATKPSKKKKKKDKKKGDVGTHADGVDVDAMDAEVEPIFDEEEWDGTEEMRKRVLDKYMDEVYGLEFNDMVGDLPTRFKYTPVQPDQFALAPAEILMATDAELNQYVGLRQFAPYREGRHWDTKRNDRLRELRGALETRGALVSSEAGRAQTADGERPTKKRKGKKERMKERAAVVEDAVAEGAQEVDLDDEGMGEEPAKKKRKRKHKKGETA